MEGVGVMAMLAQMSKKDKDVDSSKMRLPLLILAFPVFEFLPEFSIIGEFWEDDKKDSLVTKGTVKSGSEGEESKGSQQQQYSEDNHNLVSMGSLSTLINCDNDIMEIFKNSSDNEKDSDEEQTKTAKDLNILQNGWKLGKKDGSYWKKGPDGTWIKFDPTSQEYKNLHAISRKCYGTNLILDEEKCCELLRKAANNPAELIKYLASTSFSLNDVSVDMSNANPAIIVFLLDRLGVPKKTEYDPFIKNMKVYKHSKIWLSEKIDTSDLDDPQKKAIKGNANLLLYIDILVDFVNLNPKILNPDKSDMKSIVETLPQLASRGVRYFEENAEQGLKPSTAWSKATMKAIMTPYNRFSKGINPSDVTSMFGLFPQYNGMMYGGTIPSSNTTEVMIENTGTVPYFGGQIVELLKNLMIQLDSNGKTIKSKDKKIIFDQIEEFKNLE